MLQAMSTGSDQTLKQELNRSMWASSALPGCEMEDERTEVLQAVARKMLHLSPVSSTENPEVQMCVDLLAHLAHKPLVRTATAR